jgi:hypothetical protein
MMELTGIAAIAAIFTGSVLVALFIGEALTTWIIRAMDAGVRRADARKLAAQPQTAAKLLSGQRQRLQRV